LLNAASLCLGKYLFGIDPVELKALITSLNELTDLGGLFTAIDMVGSIMRSAMAVASVFQLTLLDLCSFLFTMGIIWIACRSRSLVLFLIELITDIFILFFYLGLIFFLLYSWLLTDISMGLFDSFYISLFTCLCIWISHFVFRYMGNPNPSRARSQDPFLPLSQILYLPVVAFSIMVFTMLFYSCLSPVSAFGSFFSLSFVFFIPILLFWSLRIFRMRSNHKVYSDAKFFLVTVLFLMLVLFIVCLIDYFSLFVKFYEILLLARNLRFVLVLVLSSALPSLAHLLAMAAAIIAKAIPKSLQQFINRHLDAIHGNDEKVLNQLGNGLGGLGALITAIIKLI
jgi:hypothetical protein